MNKKADNLSIAIKHIGSSTVLIAIDNTYYLGMDPALAPKGATLKFKGFDCLRVEDPIWQEQELQRVGLWLITHEHEDHIDRYGIANIETSAKIICNKAVAKGILAERECTALGWRERYKTTMGGIEITITAVPAYHGNSYLMRTLVGRGNGYLIEITKEGSSKSIYITGDTVYNRDITAKIPRHVDLLIANLGGVLSKKRGGPLTMDLNMLVDMAKDIAPKRVIPVHIDDFSHYETSKEQVLNRGYRLLPRGQWVEV